MALRDASAMMWERTDLTPADVDVAELYDGFSFITLCWLEALGFCGRGEGGPFIEGGAPHRPRRRDRRSTPTAASSRPAACTATGSCTRRACSSGVRREPVRCPTTAGWGWPPPAGAPLAGCLLLTAR